MTHEEQELNKRIKAFLEDRMSPADRAIFVAEIAASDALRTAVREQKLLLDAVELLHQDALRKKMHEWQQSPDTLPNTVATRRINWRLWIGAVLLALLSVFGYNRFKKSTPLQPTPAQEPQPPAPQDMAVTPSAPADSGKANTPKLSVYPTRITELNHRKTDLWDGKSELMSDPNHVNLHLMAAQKWMQKNRPDKAIPELKQVPETDTAHYWTAQRLLARAYFYTQNFQKAYIVFEKTATVTDFQEEAQWYQLLCLIEVFPERRTEINRLFDLILGDIDPANPYDDHAYQKAAQELKTRQRQQ